MIQQKVVVRFFLVTAAVAIVCVWIFHFISSSHPQQQKGGTSVVVSSTGSSQDTTTAKRMRSSDDSSSNKQEYISVAHLGNSIQYYDDLPRLLEHMLATKFQTVRQNSCLRGGATLTSLFEKGNGMATKFGNNNNKDIGAPTVKDLLLSIPTPSSSSSWPSLSWDFVIINDHTQSPARIEKRKQSMQTLKSEYVPLLQQQLQEEQAEATTTVIFIQTAAYKTPVKNSDDLGTFDEFTAKLQEGYADYAHLVRHSSSSNNNNALHAKVAPVGLAYQYFKHRHDEDDDENDDDDEIATMWNKLYARDDLHPSPHGTFLEACVLYCTMLEEHPPTYDVSWWTTARYMQPPDTEPLPLPTDEEADVLRQVAWTICEDSSSTSGSNRHGRRER
jgi:hypothetical protein